MGRPHLLFERKNSDLRFFTNESESPSFFYDVRPLDSLLDSERDILLLAVRMERIRREGQRESPFLCK